MRIGIDILGGDYAPDATVRGSILAYKELHEKATIVLFGNRTSVENVCTQEGFDPGNFEIIHTETNIGMDEYPAKAFTLKPDSSIPLGFKYLGTGKIDGFASAGNTGAMLVGAMQIITSIPGIIRPAIAAPIPMPAPSPTPVEAAPPPGC